MTRKIYGEDKDLVVLDKQDPYNAVMNIKEHCKNKNFQIKISISSSENNQSLLIAM
jgi:tRNA A58 N-methylase Trm61